MGEPSNGSKCALVVGASGGLGFALVQALLADNNIRQVHATVRNRTESSPLLTLAAQRSTELAVHQLDLTNEDSIAGAARVVAEHTDRLDSIINSAGLLHDSAQTRVIMPERRLDEVTARSLILNFEVNAVGPILVAKHFARFLPGQDRAVFANISARVGSIGDNRLGGWYSYRASKAAQNMLTRNLSIELARRCRRVICVALHPGTVDTELSAPFQSNVPQAQLFSTHRAAGQVLAVLASLTHEDNGQFFSWDRQVIPW